MSLALLDTTVLSNFAHVQRPDLVTAALGMDAATTPRVLAELKVGEALGYLPVCDWHWLTVVELSPEEQNMAAGLSQQVDPGEAECLAVAMVRRSRFLSDDRSARRIAELRGATVSGTLGLLVKLIKQGTVSTTEADVLLSEMIVRGYRSPVSSLGELGTG